MTLCFVLNEIWKLQGIERRGESYLWCKVGGQDDTKDLMQLLYLEETVDQLVKVSRVHCHGCVLSMDKKRVFTNAHDFKVKAR